MPAPAGIGWLPWTGAAFARARAEHAPILLSIYTAWSGPCERMARTSYADPGVVEVVARGFIPVRVDADRRPDIALRYDLGGWPTTAFLTPEGEVLAGGTFVDAPRLRDALVRVRAAFAAGEHVGRAAASPCDRETTPLPAAALARQVDEAFDEIHAGYGGAPKFPMTGPVHLALDVYRRTGDEAARARAVRTLDALGWGGLHDDRDGGFFHYAREADWSAPSREKLLTVNAALLALYVDAFTTLQLARYAERAEDVLRYLQTWLADPVDGGWSASQRGADQDSAAAAGPVDPTLFADANAAAVSAALAAGRAMNDPSLSAFAVTSLERVALLCYHPGGGVAHYHDGAPQVRGLLDDQIGMARACLDAFEASGNIVYQMMAEELALSAVRLLWDDAGGGFHDRAEGNEEIGRLRERCKPFAGNCAAARLLRRLARVSQASRFADYADRTLAAMARRAPFQGALAAEFLLAAGDPPQ